MAPHLFEIAATVYIPWPAKFNESTLSACKEILRLGICQLVLVFDRKSRHGAKIAAEVETELRGHFREQGGGISVLEVDIADTGDAWRLGVLSAFKSWPHVTSVFIYPGDLATASGGMHVLHPRFEQMVGAATEETLVLGDYDSVQDDGPNGRERFKTNFDTAIALPTIGCLFSGLLGPVEAIGQSKLRTECLIVGRKVFESCERHYRFSLGSDPTLQLILWTAEAKANPSLLQGEGCPNLKTVRVHLGELPDSPGARPRRLGQAHQMLRFVFELCLDRVFHDYDDARISGEDLGAQLLRYRSLCTDVKRLFDVTIEALQNNASELGKELEAPSTRATSQGESDMEQTKRNEYKQKFLNLLRLPDDEIDKALPGGHKYCPRCRRPLQFEGISVTHNVSPDDARRLGLAKVAEDVIKGIEGAGVTRKVAFVAPGSFHATTFDLVCRGDNGGDIEQAGFSYESVRTGVEQVALKFVRDYPSLVGAVTVAGIGLFCPAVLKLDLSISEDVSSRFQDFREALHRELCNEVTGYPAVRGTALKKKLNGHITIGYFVNPLQELEIDALLNFITTYNANFKPIVFELTKGEVTRFSDMDHYEPVK